MPEVVFLFSDIEGSTRLWEAHTAGMQDALAHHDAVARQAVAAWRGRLVKGTGDGIHAAFDDAADALAAMLQLQRAMATAAGAGSLALAVRCGLHAGPGQARDNDYFGPEVNRAARIMAAAHGGQMLVSQVVAERLAQRLPDGVALRDLGAVRLKDLARPERLWQVLAPPLRQDFPALRASVATPNNLAQPLNRFICREAVLPELQALLAEHRLVTLLGTGGIGKSRLAQELAATLMQAHPDGVWFVELAGVGAHGDDQRVTQAVAQAVASVLGVKEEPGRTLDEALRQHVADRVLLLILDNCEQVLNGAAALAKALLRAGAGLRVLATSREPLRVAGEQAYPVPALGVPVLERGHAMPSADQLLQHESVRLFVDRARSAQPAFALTPDNAAAVVDICQRLDGIALALELAAARVRALPVQAMALRLHDSFALLSTRDATVAPRQRTLQLLIDWSHDLLDAPERALYRRLSVFAGGWTLALAEAVCSDATLAEGQVLDSLAALVDKSLVAVVAVVASAHGQIQAQAADGSGQRYRLLDTVRQHAAARLAGAAGEAETMHRRHATAQLALAEAALPQLGGAHKAEALAQLDAERDNLLAALAWCAHDQHSASARCAAEQGLRLSFALRPYWLNRGLLSLGLDTTVQLLAHPGAQARDGLRARGLFNVGQLGCFMGRDAEAMPHLVECLAIAREIGDKPREAAVLQPLGMAANGLGDAAAARRYTEDALAAARALGNPRQLASALNALAQLDRMDGRLAAAAASCDEALLLAQDLGDQDYIAGLQLNLAMINLSAGQPNAASHRLRQVIDIVDQIGSRPAAVSLLDVCTGLAMTTGNAAWAARCHRVAKAEYAVAGMRRDAADAAFLQPHLQATRQALGADFDQGDGQAVAFDVLWAELPGWLANVSHSSDTDPAASAASHPGSH